jgi:hypothetical protein
MGSRGSKGMHYSMPLVSGQPTGDPDHPLLDFEIYRLFGDFFSHVSTSPTPNRLCGILLACSSITNKNMQLCIIADRLAASVLAAYSTSAHRNAGLANCWAVRIIRHKAGKLSWPHTAHSFVPWI